MTKTAHLDDKDGEAETFDLRALIGVIKRRLFVVAAIPMMLAILSLFYVAKQAPLFSAQSLLLISQSRTALENEREPLLNAAQIDALVAGELLFLKSDTFLLAIIRSEKLQIWPEYKKALKGITSPHILSEQFVELVTPPTLAEGRLLRALRAHLSSSREGSTYVVSLTALSENPDHAAHLVNVAARTFKVLSTLRGRQEARKLKDQVIWQLSQNRITLLREDANMDKIFLKGIGQLKGTAKSEFLNNFNQIKYDRMLLGKKLKDFLASTAPTKNIQNIQDVSSGLFGAKKPLSRPDISQNTTEIPPDPLAIFDSFSVERTNILSSSESLLNKLKKYLDELGKPQVYAEMANALDNAKRSTNVFAGLLKRMIDLQMRAQLYVPGVQILTNGLVPLSPSFPKKKNTVIVSLILGSALGLLIALLLDFFSSSVTSKKEIGASDNIDDVFFVKVKPKRLSRVFSRANDTNWSVENNTFWNFVRFLRKDCLVAEGTSSGVIALVASEANRNLGLLALSSGGFIAASGKKVAILDLDRDCLLRASRLDKLKKRLFHRAKKPSQSGIQHHRNLFFKVDEYYFENLGKNAEFPLSAKNLGAAIDLIGAANDYLFIVSPYNHGNELNRVIAQHSNSVVVVSNYAKSKVANILDISQWIHGQDNHPHVCSAVFGAS